MKKLSVCTLALLLAGACASDEAARRPTATRLSEPTPVAHTADSHKGVEPVRPTEVASVPSAEQTRAAALDSERDNDLSRDRQARTTTHDARTPSTLDQGNHAADLEIARKIRQAVVNDDHLSFKAKNVKIIAEEGSVTLRGEVTSDEERRKIEKYARETVGAKRVDSQLTAEP